MVQPELTLFIVSVFLADECGDLRAVARLQQATLAFPQKGGMGLEVRGNDLSIP